MANEVTQPRRVDKKEAYHWKSISYDGRHLLGIGCALPFWLCLLCAPTRRQRLYLQEESKAV